MVEVECKVNGGWTMYFIKNTSRRHREDGPAAFNTSSKLEWWYLNNNFIHCSSQEEFEKSVGYKQWKLRAFI
jgi:hypothetical protein